TPSETFWQFSQAVKGWKGAQAWVAEWLRENNVTAQEVDLERLMKDFIDRFDPKDGTTGKRSNDSWQQVNNAKRPRSSNGAATNPSNAAAAASGSGNGNGQANGKSTIPEAVARAATERPNESSDWWSPWKKGVRLTNKEKYDMMVRGDCRKCGQGGHVSAACPNGPAWAKG
ncbi:hypothetical protein Agub_g3663, partial [Astrephomene gubernaculifera]